MKTCRTRLISLSYRCRGRATLSPQAHQDVARATLLWPPPKTGRKRHDSTNDSETTSPLSKLKLWPRGLHLKVLRRDTPTYSSHTQRQHWYGHPLYGGGSTSHVTLRLA
ncbi:hypothetical protein RB213_014809 [Colletotrichum asianum]